MVPFVKLECMTSLDYVNLDTNINITTRGEYDKRPLPNFLFDCDPRASFYLDFEKQTMASQSPVHAPPHVLKLLSELHQKSIVQEAAISPGDYKNITSDTEDQYQARGTVDDNGRPTAFDRLMQDKFIALDEDKCQFMYQLINAMGATNVVEAGTSFGVSTIYLALAVAQTTAATGKPGTVIATEKETSKAQVARRYWAQCGAEVEKQIDLRVGDLRETLKLDLPPAIDLLLLDSECLAPYLAYLPISPCFGNGLLARRGVCPAHTDDADRQSGRPWSFPL